MIKKRSQQKLLKKVWDLKYLLIIILVLILIIYFNIFVTGETVLYDSDTNFSTGTFTNTTYYSNKTILSKLAFVGNYTDEDPPYSLDYAYEVYVSGDYAYGISNSDNSLTILDISDKSNPTPVGDYVNNTFMNTPTSVFVSGDYAYVTSQTGNSLTILNISNKSNPTYLSNYTDSVLPYSLDGATGVFVLNDYAYVISYDDDSLTILNITNKSNPTPVGNYNDSVLPYSLDRATSVSVSGNYAYVTSYQDDSLTILNITNKSNPTPVGDYNDSSQPYSLISATDVSVLDDYAYVSSHYSLTILNTTNKSNPTPVGDYNDPLLEGAISIFVLDDYAYVLSQNTDYLIVFNISDKSNPIKIAEYKDTDFLSTGESMYVLGDYIYVATGLLSGLLILDINYYASGDYLSEVINSTLSNADWVNVSWNETEPSQTSLSLAFRSCDDSACNGESWSSFEENSPSTLSGISNNMYFQFKAKFETTNTSVSSSLNSVSISYSNCTESWSCSAWSVCSAGTQTRTCTDANNCGTTANEPAESQTCTVPGGGSLNFTRPIKGFHSWTKITPGVAAIMKDFDEEIGIKQIQIEVHTEAQNVKLTVTKHPGKPANVSLEKSGKVYKYLQIETQNLEDKLNKGIITIQLNKSEVSDKGKVAMFKFVNNEWIELSTIYTGAENDYYYYDVELDSFSYFAIGEETEEIEQPEKKLLENKISKIILYALIGILILGVIVVGFLIRRSMLRRKNRNVFQ